MRCSFEECWEMASRMGGSLEWGYEDHEMRLLGVDGMTYFQFGDSFVLAYGDRDHSLEAIEQRLSEPGWARNSFEQYKKTMVEPCNKERLESLCYEADRLCIVLDRLRSDKDPALDEEQRKACEVFRAIYEMTLRQDPPRKGPVI